MDRVFELVKHGADVNKLDQNFCTPLHIAIVCGNLDIVRILINAGADVNIADYFGQTAWMMALKPLLKNGADVGMEGSCYETNLHNATRMGHLEILNALLEAGADVNIADSFGRTALVMAVDTGNTDIVEKLIQAGALFGATIRRQISGTRNDVKERIFHVQWNVSEFIRTQLSDTTAFENLRKMVTITGSMENSQLMSCEEYVLQTWRDRGLHILDTVIEALKIGHAASDITDTGIVRFQCDNNLLKFSFQRATVDFIVDTLEEIAWLSCVFKNGQRNGRGPFIATSAAFLKNHSAPTHGELRYILCSPDKSINKLCWTKILPNATMTVGFPVRKRIEGLGLEIPFPLLLRFADVSVSMEYDGGTILVGASTILFPSRELEDGVQWHIMDATSAQEAVQVLDQSDGWVRTRDIGRLANMRAYLGFCSQAQVLLGTRDLVISHQITELQSQLPATKRRMEMAHEGTLSAGVSFHGVFNATVGGKWYVPPRLTVSFEETRELDDLLESSCDRPVLIYDHTEDRGWLVPELRLILHMSLAYTSQENVRRRCLATVQDALPWLTASVDKNFDMKNKISSSWNFELYKKVEDGQMKTFGNVFRDFMKDFQKLRTAENLRREGKGFKFSSRTLRGWGFSELASKAENAFQREMKWRHSSRPMWTALGDTRDMLVILGSNFGNLILLDLQNTKVPSGWESVPKGAGLLTAMCRCVKKLGQTGVLLPTCSESTPKQQSAELFWYRPATFHRDCNEYCNSSCMIIHEIKDPGRWTRTCTDIKDPRSLQEDGAIIFGCASLYHEYLTR